MSGKVVTFYSYKGGVGRSFALANVAALLARWNFRVLCIDWDIEAPGLDHYFDIVREDRPGLVDMLAAWSPNQSDLAWSDYVRDAYLPDGLSIGLLPAGRQDTGYSPRAQSLDWKAMYEQGLGDAFETMIGEMRENYDFILIDSRTGITDFGGIVTAQLPDILLFMFTANGQSLEGCARVAERAQRARKAMPIDRGPLRLVPVASRFEGRVEYAISQTWRERFHSRLRPFYSTWLVQNVDHRKIVDLTTIPHVPFWTFGEGLAVLDEAEGGYSPESISYSIETIAALLAQDLAATEILAESRDLYVNTLQRREERRRVGVENIYLSYSLNDTGVAERLKAVLAGHGISCLGSELLHADPARSLGSFDQINRAQHMLILIGREFGQWQLAELRSFRTQSAVDERPRYLIPVLLEPDVKIPDMLLSYKSLQLDGDFQNVIDSVLEIVGVGPAAV
jgi:cellulose biosynthesis protein BcsQ